MSVAGGVTYGNDFPMIPGHAYRIQVHARIPGAREPITVVFQYRVPSVRLFPVQSALA